LRRRSSRRCSAAKITAFVAARFARRFWRWRNFCDDFGAGSSADSSLGAAIGGHLPVRFAKTAFGFRLVVLRVFVMFRSFSGRGGGFNRFGRRRIFFGVGRAGSGGRGPRPRLPRRPRRRLLPPGRRGEFKLDCSSGTKLNYFR
jgi:hypothetical protein